MLRKHQLKTLWLIGLTAIMSTLAFSAYGAGSASAAPELLWCMETSGAGTYSSQANCEKLVTGGTGWEYTEDPLTGETVVLDFTSGKGLIQTTPNGLHIECASDEGTAELLLVGGLQVFDTTVKFLGCIELTFGGECNSTAPLGAKGEIITTALTGELVYLKKAKALPVGLLLTPVAQPFTTLSCLGGLIKEKVEGSIIGEVVSPINTQAASGVILFAENAAKEQQWTKVEEEAAKFELSAFGEKAVEVSEEATTLLINGVAKVAEVKG